MVFNAAIVILGLCSNETSNTGNSGNRSLTASRRNQTSLLNLCFVLGWLIRQFILLSTLLHAAKDLLNSATIPPMRSACSLCPQWATGLGSSQLVRSLFGSPHCSYVRDELVRKTRTNGTYATRTCTQAIKRCFHGKPCEQVPDVFMSRSGSNECAVPYHLPAGFAASIDATWPD